MNKKIRAEFIILKESPPFFWMLNLSWVIIAYNIVKIAIPLVNDAAGGYYLYNILALEIILAIFVPILLGALLGGVDYRNNIIQYKFTNESRKDFLKSKIIFLVLLVTGYLVISALIGIFWDICAGTFSGDFGSNLLLILERLMSVLVVWIMWGILGFFFSIVLKSTGLSVILCIFLYYAEQYIGSYLPNTISRFGVVWNQKSVLICFFSDESIPFGIVQSAYNSVWISSVFIVAVMIACILASVRVTKQI